MRNDALRLFGERQAFWVESGFTGRALYAKLATDPELPLYFDETAAAAMAGLTPRAMAARRARKMLPSYLAHSRRSVRYPRYELFSWLGDMFCDRGAA